MKKIFTIALAVLASASLIKADETIFLWQYDGSSVYGDGSNGVFDVDGANPGTIKFVTFEKKKSQAEDKCGFNAAVEDNDLKPEISKVCKLGNNGAHFRISPAEGNFEAGDILYICGSSPISVKLFEDHVLLRRT